jgi:hypothetical protein
MNRNSATKSKNLFDDSIRPRQDAGRNAQADLLCRFEINHQL